VAVSSDQVIILTAKVGSDSRLARKAINIAIEQHYLDH
jgi:hypothetical protein